MAKRQIEVLFFGIKPTPGRRRRGGGGFGIAVVDQPERREGLQEGHPQDDGRKGNGPDNNRFQKGAGRAKQKAAKRDKGEGNAPGQGDDAKEGGPEGDGKNRRRVEVIGLGFGAKPARWGRPSGNARLFDSMKRR